MNFPKPSTNSLHANTPYFHTSMIGVLALVVAIMLPGFASADTGIIRGQVNDAQTGEAMIGATVSVQDLDIGVTTDMDGRYVLRNVPEGEQTIVFRYVGFETRESVVEVTAGESIQLNMELEPDIIEGDEIFVQARQRGTSRSLTSQRESSNIRSIISSEQMEAFGDQTVASSLSRVAGMGHGSTNIRGIGGGMANVTMDGQRMGGTGTGDRSVDVSTISADMVQDLEVIKVITPDMDADALSGVININTRRPVGGERDVNVRLGGGWDSRFLGVAGPSRRASFSYGDSPSDNFSFAVNLSYLRTISTTERFSLDWATRNFINVDGPSDVLDGFETRMEHGNRDRYGAGIQFTFQPTERSTYHVRGNFNYQDRQDFRYEHEIEISTGRYVQPDDPSRPGLLQTGELGMPGNQDRISYSNRMNDRQINQYTVMAGARHRFDSFEMDYALSWGHGRQDRERYDFPFRTPQRFNYFVDIEDRWNTVVDIAPHGEISTWPRASTYSQSGISYRWGSWVDNDFRGSMDIEVPVPGFGYFKFGSSALMTYQQGEYEQFSGGFDGGLNISSMDLLVNQSWSIFGRDHRAYQIPYLLDLEKAQSFYHGQRPHFSVDYESWASSSELEDFFSNENIYAVYGMTEADLGSLTFLGGMRVEHTRTRYSGKEVSFDTEGNLDAVKDVVHPNSYTNFFPNAQFIYGIGQMTNVRLAYSKSIARPSFSQLSPSIERDYDSQSLEEGNPELDPMASHNLDFMVDHYFMNVGQFSVGLFYKELSEFVITMSDRYERVLAEMGIEVDDESPYYGWDYQTFMNVDESMVYGLEVTWQQNLEFLPGFLSNIGIYSTYSYTYSETDIGRKDTDGNIIWERLEGQRPHVVNLGLDYSQGGFSGQLNYQGSTPTVSSYGDQRHVPGDPNLPVEERVWFDAFTDASNDLSATLRYRITSEFRLWFNANNLLFNRRVDYYYDRDIYPDEMRLGGRSFDVGIRYSL